MCIKGRVELKSFMTSWRRRIAIRRILRSRAAVMTRTRDRESSRRIIIVGKGRKVKGSAVRYDGRDFDFVVVRFDGRL